MYTQILSKCNNWNNYIHT